MTKKCPKNVVCGIRRNWGFPEKPELSFEESIFAGTYFRRWPDSCNFADKPILCNFEEFIFTAGEKINYFVVLFIGFWHFFFDFRGCLNSAWFQGIYYANCKKIAKIISANFNSTNICSHKIFLSVSCDYALSSLLVSMYFFSTSTFSRSRKEIHTYQQRKFKLSPPSLEGDNLIFLSTSLNFTFLGADSAKSLPFLLKINI